MILLFKSLKTLLFQICNKESDLSWEQFDEMVEQAKADGSITDDEYRWLMASEEE